MASSKTVAKGIRISNESAEYFSGKPLNRMVESLMELLESGKVRFDGESLTVDGVHDEIVKPAESVHSANNYDLPTLKDLKSMANCFGITIDDLLGMIDEGLNEGTILIEGGRVISSMPHWVERFEEVCRDKCLDSEKVGESAVKAIERGTLQ